jgi:hypothetical protein
MRYPEAVGTKSERDKLMFRIRVRIDPERLRARADAVRSGLPGVAYRRERFFTLRLRFKTYDEMNAWLTDRFIAYAKPLRHFGG